VTGGVLASDCAALMSDFFAQRRARQKALKQTSRPNPEKPAT
jgi:hypothetical protein